jgi:biopolymer transport protein ExbB/TolQ
MDSSIEKDQKETPRFGRTTWALLGAAMSFVIAASGNIASCRKTVAETENLRAQSDRLREEVRASQAKAGEYAQKLEDSRRVDEDREERSARAWLELIRTSSNLEDRVLALEWLRIRSPYTSIRETAQNELQRIRDSEGVRKLERESDVLKKERTEVGRGGGQNLQRVEQAKKVLLLRDLFGTVPPPQRKGAL